jgi:hypothetical protein
MGNAAPFGKLPHTRQAMRFFKIVLAIKPHASVFYVDALVFNCISVFLCKKLTNKNVLIITKLFQKMSRYPLL